MLIHGNAKSGSLRNFKYFCCLGSPRRSPSLIPAAGKMDCNTVEAYKRKRPENKEMEKRERSNYTERKMIKQEETMTTGYGIVFLIISVIVSFFYFVFLYFF